MPAKKAKTLQEQKRDFTRTRLMDAALEMFGTKGYDATTADDIATTAGCSRQAFYLHFKSKSLVMVAILERAWPDVVATTNQVIAAIDAGMTKAELRGNVAAQLGLWLPQPGGIGAVNVAILTDQAVADWFDANASPTFDALAKLGAGRSITKRRQRRAQLAALSRMTLAAFDLVDGHRDEPDKWRKDILDYLTDLWADLLVVGE